jgi:hypothetical protein
MRLFHWWLLPDSNWGHKALQASALPTELKSHNRWYSTVLPLFIQGGQVLLGFFGQEVFDVFDGAHELGREDDGAVLFAGNLGKGL